MICEKEKCTGCFACYNICPKKAITMKEDSNGSIYPEVDTEKCINCRLCNTVCPQINNNIEFRTPIAAYALYYKNNKKRSESSSGGAASLFSEEILKNGGIVYGASNLFGKKQFSFVRVDKIEDLFKVKGSKYVHCYINDTYSEIKKDLINNKMVLFIATPCQIAGLKSFLQKDFENLICVDIVCHGVPNQQLLFDEFKMLKLRINDIYSVSFRDDKFFNLTIKDKNNKMIFTEPSDLVPYYDMFLKGISYRENCYECKYAKNIRISDITIGDFWGLAKNSKIYDDEKKGISLVMPITNKGMKLIKKIEDNCYIDERTTDEAYRNNGQLNHPMKKNDKHDIFFEVYKKSGYKKAVKKVYSIQERLKKLLKRILKKDKSKRNN